MSSLDVSKYTGYLLIFLVLFLLSMNNEVFANSFIFKAFFGCLEIGIIVYFYRKVMPVI